MVSLSFAKRFVQSRPTHIIALLTLYPLAAIASAGDVFVTAPADIWTVPGVNSPAFESHPAFDPNTGDLYFVRSTTSFAKWRLMVAKCRKGAFHPPKPVSFRGPGVEADPTFSRDGNTIWFISTRRTGSEASKDLDIWATHRRRGGNWSAPVRLPAPINSDYAEWFPREAVDGWFYFGSNRPGGFGGNDIWRARKLPGGYWEAENAGPNVNSPGDEYEPLPSPDGSSLLIEAADGYYMAKQGPKGWMPRTRLGSELNANGTEVGALYSPSGETLLFGRDAGPGRSGDLHRLRLGNGETWPSCSR